MDIVGFEHLHQHSMYSTLDGYGTCEEYAAHWKSHGDYLCITDHGMMAAIPSQIRACAPTGKKGDPNKDKKLTPLFGIEFYLNPLQIEANSKEEFEAYKKTLDPGQLKLLSKKGYHLLAIATNNTGYKNLVRLSSLAWTKGYFYGRPRINHEQLRKYKEGIFFTSCCYASETGCAFDAGGEDAAFPVIEKYIEMFGDHFFLEIMLLDFKKQKPYNQFIIKCHEKYKLPLIVTQDCHFCKKEDSKYQRLMLMVQTKNTVESIDRLVAEGKADDLFELQDQSLWMKTEEELNEKWQSDYSDTIDYDLFKQAKKNTVDICRRAAGVELDRSMKLPQLPDADEKLKELAWQGFCKRNLPKNRKYLDRFKEEYALIKHKGFSSYLLIQKQMVDEARRVCPQILGWGDGSEAIGPGRGSCGASLLFFCLGITDVDPVKHDLLFSRFLNEARGGRMMKLKFTIDPIN